MANLTRSALLTGVSLAAVGMITPTHALAQTIEPGGGSTTSGSVVNDTITINTICDDDAFLWCGVTDTNNSGDATAVVSDTSNGQIEQIGIATTDSAVINLQMNNTDSGIIQAGAYAYDEAASAVTANATILEFGIHQAGTTLGPDINVVINADISNNAYLGIGAIAEATNAVGGAAAYARIGTAATGSNSAAIWQSGQGGTVDLSIYNGPATPSGTTSAFMEILASAEAYVSGSGGVPAAIASAYIEVGIAQVASEASGVADMNLTNDGIMFIQANADADATEGLFADADAHINIGIVQYAEEGPSSAAAMIQNNGLLGVGAVAYASGNSAADAEAFIGIGIGQIVSATSANATMVNAGAIAVQGIAGAWGSSEATAQVQLGTEGAVIMQEVGGASAGALIDNQGGLMIAYGTAGAYASSGAAVAEVNGAAIGQEVSGLSVDADIANSGTMGGSFRAVAAASDDAQANVDALVLYQTGEAMVGDYHIENNGLLVGYATANADADFTRAGANAQLVGAWQVAYGSDIGVSLNNTSEMLFRAIADAEATANATATAQVGNVTSGADYYSERTAGLEQFAAAESADVSFSNSGTVGIAAAAFASASDAEAAAQANGLDQYAYGAGVANISLVNGTSLTGTSVGTFSACSGTVACMGVFAGAFANGSNAFAEAAAYGNVQVGNVGSTTASVNLYGENWGVLAVGANAYASGSSFAGASAEARGGLVQIAFADGDLSNANLQVVNNGLIDVAANATALGGGSNADAYATAGGGVFQQIFNLGSVTESATAPNAVAMVTNGGTINIAAHASGTSAGDPDASANAGRAVNQLVFNLGGGSAVAMIDNSGVISVSGEAVVEDGGFGYAFARVGGDGLSNIGQLVIAQNANASIANAGDIMLVADADVTNVSSGEAAAYARDGLGQVVLGSTAAASISNATSAAIFMSANAYASGGNVDVDAWVDKMVEQVADANGGDASVHLDNLGAISALASVSAIGNFAGGGVGLGTETAVIGQYAYADGAVASVALFNGGNISIGGNVNVSATTGFVNADADIGIGIYQSAINYASGGSVVFAPLAITSTGATVMFTNTGTLTAFLDVDAVGISVEAEASADWILLQNAAAVAGDANASIMNSGIVDIDISANGSAVANGAGIAGLDNGFGQHVYASTGDAAAAFTNSGTIDALVAGFGSGEYAVGAARIGTGESQGFVQQEVYVNSSGAVAMDFVNTGGIKLVADADASGDTANADADVWGFINQSNEDGTASMLVMNITNSGTMSLSANAFATGTDASANAYAYGIWQHSRSGNANNAVGSITNNGTLHVDAVASAVGTGVADAYAVASGAWQTIDAATGAVTATFLNTSVYGLKADADASGTNAFAAAEATTMIWQGLDGVTAANANVTNSGTMSIVAMADAVAAVTGNAAASAYASGLAYQSADATGTSGTANANLVNNGLMSALGDANATAASEASALAGAYGIYQAARANGTSGVANAMLTNAATISVGASAFASGGTYANADAQAFGVEQIAEGSSANAMLHNGGLIDVFANATAINADGPAYAYADADGLSQQGEGSTVYVSITNAATLSVHATASAEGNGGGAYAYADGVYQRADATGATATAFFSNTGMVDVGAMADLAGAGSSFGQAYAVASGVDQNAEAGTTSGYALASAINSGTIMIHATASATGNHVSANAYAYGVDQYAEASSANVFMSNSGAVSISAMASAHADTSARAYAGAYGAIEQYATGETAANATFYNGGTVAAVASAHASAFSTFTTGTPATTTTVGNASAYAYAYALTQTAYVDDAGTASASIWNSGVIAASANFSANGGDYGYGYGGANAVQQMAFGYASESVAAYAYLGNSGLIVASASGTASGANFANAYINADAVYQVAYGSTAHATISNGGTISAYAFASASAASGSAYAGANAQGVTQSAYGTTAGVAMYNSGSVVASADANAAAGTYANAYASANGVFQFVGAEEFATGSYSAIFTNSGMIDVDANAVASGVGTAEAYGQGYEVYFANNGTFDIGNGGDIDVMANAMATSGYAGARAQGMIVRAFGTVTDPGTLVGTSDDVVMPGVASGTLTNSGNIVVAAVASGSLGSTTTPVLTTSGPGTAIASTLTTYTASSAAYATGILVTGGLVNATVENTGTIMVDAWTANGDAADVGGYTNAYGVRVTGNEGAFTPTTETFVFTNDGGMIQSRVSGDGGATFARGFAVDVSEAPNPSIINLYGEGDIYGHIHLQDGDTVNVEMGRTSFDGLFNPDMELVGDLIISNGGELFLRDDPHRTDNMYDGPAGGWLDTLTIEADGTIVYELPVYSDPALAEASYPQLFVNTANLDGTLLVHPNSENGLYADEYFFDNVIKTTNDADASSRNGMFDTCGVDGGTIFLALECIYDASGNVDLGLERIAFDDFDFDTQNQLSTAGAIECFYGLDL
ncbi:hypothetical protein, partial [Sphingomicrobium nitratireducens]|uniref:hypothetical protein n=1 Tax=Sphingomicrobium nitratireducens TaxID=2964666 RepID=UPI00223EE7CF